MKKVLTLALTGLLLAPVAVAETGEDSPLFVSSSSLGISREVPSSKLRLIDPGRLRNSNEFIMSYNSSGNNPFQGLYLSTFNYRLANPLDVSVTLGASFVPQGGFGESSQSSVFLSSFGLRYQPNESTLIQFHYQDPRGVLPYYYGNPFANRWWYRDR